MKYLKILMVTILAMFTFGSAIAQTRPVHQRMLHHHHWHSRRWHHVHRR